MQLDWGDSRARNVNAETVWKANTCKTVKEMEE